MYIQTRVESFTSAKVIMEYINDTTSLDLNNHFLVHSNKPPPQASVRILAFRNCYNIPVIAWNHNINFYKKEEIYNEVSNQEFINILVKKFPKDNSLVNKEENTKVKFPCPHPEWEGIWDYEGVGWKIEWTGETFDVKEIHDPNHNYLNWQPKSGWVQLEQGNQESINKGKLLRPKVQKNQIKVPWDIYDE